MKRHLDNTILRLMRTTPYYRQRSRGLVCKDYLRGVCPRSNFECPYTHEMPFTPEGQKINDRYYHPWAAKMPSLEPPDDESIRTLYVCGLDGRIKESDLRDELCAHGEIETMKMVPSRAYAFVTYMTRESVEKASKELSNILVMKGLRLELMWGRPQESKLDDVVSDEARQQGVTHSELLQNHVPGLQDQPPKIAAVDQAPPGLRKQE